MSCICCWTDIKPEKLLKPYCIKILCILTVLKSLSVPVEKMLMKRCLCDSLNHCNGHTHDLEDLCRKSQTMPVMFILTTISSQQTTALQAPETSM